MSDGRWVTLTFVFHRSSLLEVVVSTHVLSCLTVSRSLYRLKVSRYSIVFCSTGFAPSLAAAPLGLSGSSSFSRRRVSASEMLIVFTSSPPSSEKPAIRSKDEGEGKSEKSVSLAPSFAARVGEWTDPLTLGQLSLSRIFLLGVLVPWVSPPSWHDSDIYKSMGNFGVCDRSLAREPK